MVAQGRRAGACGVEDGEGRFSPACEATYRERDGITERLVMDLLLSRPEHYLSVYQSGCNLSCRKCHSAEFSQRAKGRWMSPEAVTEAAVAYDGLLTVREPRERATAFHAHDLCRGCGSCVLYGQRHPRCPDVLSPEQLTVSPQGIGPARNIVAFTGGDLACRPAWYAETTRRIKAETGCWVLMETNGFGLTPSSLDSLAEAGLDAFWLDIKAYEPEVHDRLTGAGNEELLALPRAIRERGFVLEVLSLHIPGWVETDQIGAIASSLAAVDPAIPMTVLAFFPAYGLSELRAPTAEELVASWQAARRAGLEHVRVGNVGVVAKSEEDLETLRSGLSPGAW